MGQVGKRGLIMCAVAAVCAIAPGLGALLANEVETDYFTDGTFTTEVGSTVLLCNGGRLREGKTSRFVVRFEAPCRTGDLTEIACIVDGVPTTCPRRLCDSELISCS